jgi:Leucine-rich repeat (LRR) protein
VPKAVLGWKKTLKRLELARNQIKKVDELNETFEKLETVDLSRNPIDSLPEKGLAGLYQKQNGNFLIMIYNAEDKEFFVSASLISNMRKMINGNAKLTIKS